MHNSLFLDGLGCLGNETERNESRMQLDDTQCVVVHVSLLYLLIFGVIGCFVHAYIIFCYNFKIMEEQIPVQTLILSLSVFDFFCCLFLIAAWIISQYNVINKSFTCSIYVTFSSIDRNTIYAVVCLLAANRYYSICKPPQQYIYLYSSRRIKLYMSTIFFVGLGVSLADQVYYCYCDGEVNGAYELVDTILNAIYCVSTMSLTIFLYIQIARKMSQRIKDNEALNQIRVNVSTELEDSFSEETPAVYMDNLFDYDLKVERAYLKAIAASAFISMPLLMLQLAFEMSSKLNAVSEGQDVRLDSDNKTLFLGNLIMLDLFANLFILNPIIFYFTNEDFKIKLNRPLREVKKFLKQD